MYLFSLIEAGQYAQTADIMAFIAFEAIPKPE